MCSCMHHISRLPANSRQNPSPYPSPGTPNPISLAFLVGGRRTKKGAKGTQSLQYATPQPPNNENSLPKRSPRRQNALQDTKMTAKGLHHCCREPIKHKKTSVFHRFSCIYQISRIPANNKQNPSPYPSPGPYLRTDMAPRPETM